MLILASLLTVQLASAFTPHVGDEASYEVTTPIGSTLHRRVIENFDETKDKYEVAIYQEANGQEKKQVEWIDAAKVKAVYVGDLGAFCAERGGQLTQVEFERRQQPACYTLKDNGVLKQEDFWMAGVPFATYFSEKKSPLHPKAGTTTRLLSFQLAPR
ncbi:MAG: hypothetical protein KF767_07025 [Bdellovibrionaceae bacterium]|nr:hypothetical protein [Pseudobdellovibrionaceae bacterium]